METQKLLSRLGQVVLGLVLVGGFTSCIQFSGIQTAQTLGKNRSEIMGAVGGLSTQVDFDLDSTSSATTVVVPNMELSYRYGVTENLDLGFKYSFSNTLLLSTKYQFLGGKAEGLAMAVGAEIGWQGLPLVPDLFQVHIPAFISYHPTEKFAIYTNPRYVTQFSSSIDGSINYFGLSSGIEFGRDVCLPVDVSWFKVLNEGDQDIVNIPSIFYFSTGIKIRFGGN